MEKWKCQLIRLLFHYSRKRTTPATADLVKDPHIPAALYKFRHFCDRHKEALEQGVLWRTPPSLFNDPYDSAIYFDTERFYMEDFSPTEFAEAIAKAKAGIKFEPRAFKKPIQLKEYRDKLLMNLLRHQSKETAEACLKLSDDQTRKTHETMVTMMSNSVREGYSVISFAGEVTSVLMWSHYSLNHRGFCIEYNLFESELRRFCYPVFYRKKLTDATRYMAKKDPRDFNNLFPIYTTLLKSDEWDYEQEWRIVMPVGAPLARDRVHMPKPSAIILGALVEPVNEEWMKQFCDRRSIRLKKMVQHFHEFRLEASDLKPVRA